MKKHTSGQARVWLRSAIAILITGGVVITATNTASGKKTKTDFCTQTSKEWFKSCSAAVVDDYRIAQAKCINLSDAATRATCLQTAVDDRKSGNDDCQTALDWRLSICPKTGEARYDPVINPANFETDYHNLINPNPYFPITVGNHWEYVGGGEKNTVDILDHTKLISGVTCVVAQDLVFNPLNLSESANDWYCQATDRTVWYFGEETAQYVTTPGDNPPIPELVNIDGSFQQGRDGSKGGIIFEANPAVGDTYVEESAIGEAEDATDVLSTTYAYGTDPQGLDKFVPAALANLLCSNHDCVVTSNYSLLEPGLFDHKYYARGIGVFLEVDVSAGEIAGQLVACNVDPVLCPQLPQP